MFEVKNLLFAYDKNNQIFRECSFSLEFDEVTLLIGPNGSGKTTLCRLLLGLEQNYSGSILLKSKNLQKIKKTHIAKEVIYLKQDAAKNIVAATADLDLRIWQTKFKFKDNKKFLAKRKKALHYFRINSLGDRPVWQLSGGQVKRVGLSSILLQKNKYLILDEQFSGIDYELRKSLQELIIQRKSEGLGALIISHENYKISSFADNTLQIINNKIFKI